MTFGQSVTCKQFIRFELEEKTITSTKKNFKEEKT